MPRLPWAIPATIRSRLVLEVASELVADSDFPLRQAKVSLREQSAGGDWRLQLFGSSGIEGIHEVVSGEAALAIVNPANLLMLAYRGLPPFGTPQPVRVITVLPSEDQCVFAVRPEIDLQKVDELATKQIPIKIALREQTGHSLHYIFDGILAACGIDTEQIERWGGEVRREGLLPFPDGPKFAALVEGKIDAIFDEGARAWVNEALAEGMRILPLSSATAKRLSAAGYRESFLPKSVFPALPSDVLSVDYSGWPVFVHRDLSDELVTKMCRSLESRKHLIPWEGEGPLPLARMCTERPDCPQLVPLHPAAERFWAQQGYF